MATINPYLNFSGNTEEAFNFYKSVFGKDFSNVSRFRDMPDMMPNLPEADKDKIMHISLPINDEVTLMGTDVLESAGQSLTHGNNISLAIKPASKEDGEKLFTALAAGGQVEMPYEQAPWNAYFGMLTDKFGIKWMVNYDILPS